MKDATITTSGRKRFSIPSATLLANRAAKAHGTNRATKIIKSVECRRARVVKFDPYHAESRTGIRACMAALKRFWNTYHYVPTVCVVVVPDIDGIYSNDDH
jgi:hypothetical protein